MIKPDNKTKNPRHAGDFVQYMLVLFLFCSVYLELNIQAYTQFGLNICAVL